MGIISKQNKLDLGVLDHHQTFTEQHKTEYLQITALKQEASLQLYH